MLINNFSLLTQVLLFFILGSLLLLPIQLSLINYQVEWFQSIQIDVINSLNTNQVFVDLQLTIKQMALYGAIEISHYYKRVDEISTILKQINHGGLLVSNDPILWINDYNLTTPLSSLGNFYSKDYPYIEPYTWQLANSTKALNGLTEDLKDKLMIAFYVGFESNQLFYINPGELMPEQYTPVVREWYFKAILNKGSSVLTEPYIDAVTGDLMMTISKSVLNSSSVYAVVGIDIMVSSINIFMTEFIKAKEELFIVSTFKGSILYTPWGLPQAAKIFQHELTGINVELWTEVTKNPKESLKFRFQYIDGQVFTCFRSFILSYDSKYATLVIIGCISEPILKETYSKFDSNRSTITWVTMSSTSTILLINLLILWGVILIIKGTLKRSMQSLKLLLRSSLKIEPLKQDPIKPMKHSIGITTKLTESFNTRIEEIHKKYAFFSEYTWNITRPTEAFIFDSSCSTLFPRNRLSVDFENFREVFRAQIPFRSAYRHSLYRSG